MNLLPFLLLNFCLRDGLVVIALDIYLALPGPNIVLDRQTTIFAKVKFIFSSIRTDLEIRRRRTEDVCRWGVAPRSYDDQALDNWLIPWPTRLIIIISPRNGSCRSRCYQCKGRQKAENEKARDDKLHLDVLGEQV